MLTEWGNSVKRVGMTIRFVFLIATATILGACGGETSNLTGTHASTTVTYGNVPNLLWGRLEADREFSRATVAGRQLKPQTLTELPGS